MVGDAFFFDKLRETENTVVWQAENSDERFELYVQKTRVPEPYPSRVKLAFSDGLSDSSVPFGSSREAGCEGIDRSLPIFTILDLRYDTSEHFRFAPVGERATWEVRDLYIPQSLFRKLKGKRIEVEVSWKFFEQRP